MGTKKIKIVEVIDELEIGGAQRVVFDLVNNINKNIFDVTIICKKRAKNNSSFETQLLSSGVKIIFLSWNFHLRTLQLFLTLSRLRPNIIHAHQWGVRAAIWGYFHRVKTIFTVHTTPDFAIQNSRSKKLMPFILSLHCVIFVAISHYNMILCKNYWALKDNEILFINNGVTLNKCCIKEHSVFSFINIGRQDINKNQILILNAFSQFIKNHPNNNFMLYLLGDGKENGFLHKSVNNLGLKDFVTFTGFTADVLPYIIKSDVYISSSHREGLSLSVLQAMSAGLPIIATDAGGVRELAKENGILINDDDKDAMVNAMELLYKNKKTRIAMGKKSLEMVKNYSMEQFVKGYEELFIKYSKRK